MLGSVGRHSWAYREEGSQGVAQSRDSQRTYPSWWSAVRCTFVPGPPEGGGRKRNFLMIMQYMKRYFVSDKQDLFRTCRFVSKLCAQQVEARKLDAAIEANLETLGFGDEESKRKRSEAMP